MQFKEWFFKTEEWKPPQLGIKSLQHGGDRKKSFSTAIREARPVKPQGHLIRRQFAPLIGK